MNVDFIIRELDESIVKDVHRIDDEFVIDTRLILTYENDRLSCQAVPVPPRTKRYPPDDYDYATYVNNPEKTAFLAYTGDRVAGELILHRHWNAFTWVEGIGVDKQFRRYGIGRALLERGVAWARQRGLPGIMAETQDNNAQACRFYESCGFVLRGFDTGLYHASPEYRDEIALFWYLIFEDAPSAP